MKRGQTLVATLIVIAILAVLAVALLRPWAVGGNAPSPRKDKLGTTVPGLVKLEAKDDVCRSNLQQVRAGIQIAQTSSDENPATLEELRLGSDFLKCPVGGERFQYDPATGRVTCPHPGHEAY